MNPGTEDELNAARGMLAATVVGLALQLGALAWWLS
jgi:hypothetical protein